MSPMALQVQDTVRSLDFDSLRFLWRKQKCAELYNIYSIRSAQLVGLGHLYARRAHPNTRPDPDAILFPQL